MNKTFTFIAITILLLSPFIPARNAIATKENESKTMEVPVKIYTLHGVKEIKKELPMNEAKELLDLFNEARDAVKLMNSHATFKEKNGGKCNNRLFSFQNEGKWITWKFINKRSKRAYHRRIPERSEE